MAENLVPVFLTNTSVPCRYAVQENYTICGYKITEDFNATVDISRLKYVPMASLSEEEKSF